MPFIIDDALSNQWYSNRRDDHKNDIGSNRRGIQTKRALINIIMNRGLLKWHECVLCIMYMYNVYILLFE